MMCFYKSKTVNTVHIMVCFFEIIWMIIQQFSDNLCNAPSCFLEYTTKTDVVEALLYDLPCYCKEQDVHSCHLLCAGYTYSMCSSGKSFECNNLKKFTSLKKGIEVVTSARFD